MDIAKLFKNRKNVKTKSNIKYSFYNYCCILQMIKCYSPFKGIINISTVSKYASYLKA